MSSVLLYWQIEIAQNLSVTEFYPIKKKQGCFKMKLNLLENLFLHALSFWTVGTRKINGFVLLPKEG